jgi:hypothetical protein
MQVKRKGILKPAARNESLHETSSGNGIRVVTLTNSVVQDIL